MAYPKSTLANFEYRFWRKVNKTETCWLWTGEQNGHGYGVFRPWGRHAGWVPAHRVAYEMFVGPIPERLTLDHKCRVRNCVNPAHLEAVTNRENIVRGSGWAGQKARQTHCVNGHPLTGENLLIMRGRRVCLACKREKNQLYVAGKRAAGFVFGGRMRMGNFVGFSLTEGTFDVLAFARVGEDETEE